MNCSDLPERIAAPMVGGMISAPLLSMFVIPAVYLITHRPRKQRSTQIKPSATVVTGYAEVLKP